MPDFQMMAAGYVGFRSRAMARKRVAHILCKCKHLRSQSPNLFKNDGHFLDVLVGQFDAQKNPGQHPGQHFAKVDHRLSGGLGRGGRFASRFRVRFDGAWLGILPAAFL
jgi:hypothetical protein